MDQSGGVIDEEQREHMRQQLRSLFPHSTVDALNEFEKKIYDRAVAQKATKVVYVEMVRNTVEQIKMRNQEKQRNQQAQQQQVRFDNPALPMAMNQGPQRAPMSMGPQPVQQQFMVQAQMHQQPPHPGPHQMNHMQQQMQQQQQQQQQQAALMPGSQDPMSALQTMNPNSQGMAIGPQEMMRQQMPVQHPMNQMAGAQPGPRAGRMAYPVNQPQMLPPHGASSPGMPAHSWTPGPGTPMSVSSPRPQSGMVPSPAAPHYYNNVTLNTPVMSNMSHASPSAAPSPQSEEQKRYAEKLQQLSKFIDPLRKMIERIERDDMGQNKNEVTKIKRLLDIISDPQPLGRGVPLETLLKCEQVLEKMDFKLKPIHPAIDQQSHMQQMHQSVSSSNICQPLVDAIFANIKKPHFQSTLSRTFSPAAAALGIIQTNSNISSFRSDIANESVECRMVRRQEEVDGLETSGSKQVLEGEIARLDSKFKVEEDVFSHPASRSTQLIVNLDSLDLPYVPALVVRIPESYPTQPPVYLSEQSQAAGDEDNFFTRIESLFRSNCQKLPASHSLTSLLLTWEQSVRQACSASL